MIWDENSRIALSPDVRESLTGFYVYSFELPPVVVGSSLHLYGVSDRHYATKQDKRN